MTGKVSFEVREVGAGGAVTFRVDYFEGELSEASRDSFEAMIVPLVNVIVAPHQHNGSKVVTVETVLDDVLRYGLSAVGVLRDAEVFALEGQMVEAITARRAAYLASKATPTP